MRGLFFTSDAGLYGASRSLQLLLADYHKYSQIDIVVAKRLIGPFPIDKIRQRFSKANLRGKFHLPLDYCIKGKPEPAIARYAYQRLLRVLWLLDKKELYSHLHKGNYDFVHFNSLVLHSLLVPDLPCILHVREIYDGSNPKVFDSVQKAHGLIFIDDATLAPFAHIDIPPHLVLSNPFDMRPVANASVGEFKRYGIDPDQHVIFAVIGRITTEKGVPFIVRSFLGLENPDARLLIVGSGDFIATRQVRMLAQQDQRIVIAGEREDMFPVYAAADYVVRGESYACIGRTPCEALFAGCEVIVPGDKSEVLHMMRDFHRFHGRIHTYMPRNQNHLISRLEKLARQKIRRGEPQSNTAEYAEKFDRFVKEIIAQ